jgi:hypothetical protein
LNGTGQDRVTATTMAVPILALLVVPALVVEEGSVDPALQSLAHAVNWIVWIAFCVEFFVRWAANNWRWNGQQQSFDLFLIVVSPPFLVPDYLQGARAIRVVRVLRLLRLLYAGAVATIGLRLARDLFDRRKFHYIALVALAVVFMGAWGVFLFESRRTSRSPRLAMRSGGPS